MIGNEGLLMMEVRRALAQEASIPALRMGLLLLATFAAVAWVRRRPSLTLFWLGVFGLVGLGYWLVQIQAPFGLGTDAVLTRQWAQAGVNSAAERSSMGFVVGTPEETSLVAALALSGLSLPIVHVVPQVCVLLCLGLQLLFPMLLFRNRTNGIFAAGLAVSGGVWPGVSPYGGVLRDPSAFTISTLFIGLILLGTVAFRKVAWKRLRNSAVGVSIGVIALAAFGRALQGGTDTGIGTALLQIAASVLLASPLRVFLRRISSAGVRARRAEALVLLATLGGSGLLWWNPPTSVPGFEKARDVNEALQRPMNWIRRHVPPGSVVLASPAYSASIAALAGRRVLFPPSQGVGPAEPLPEPFRRNRLAVSASQGLPIARLAEAFSVTHLFLGPGEATPSPYPAAGEEEGAEPRLSLVPAYQDAADFRVFRLGKK